MRIEATATSLSWIPSELVTGLAKLSFSAGITEYDRPLEDELGDLHAWRDEGKFRFANIVGGAIEVDANGSIVDARHLGDVLIGRTKINVGRQMLFPAIAMPKMQQAPEIRDGYVRFVQTCGGRAPVAVPRFVAGRLHLASPVIWTTLALDVYVDGSSSCELIGASPFPRHWMYDNRGALFAKAGVTDFDTWFKRTIDERSPWGGEDSPALMTEAESHLERQIAADIMGRPHPQIESLPAGEALCRQGEHATDVFLLLDGVVDVDVDGQSVAEIGPGAILGERAGLEGGVRTATLTAKTPIRFAVAENGAVRIDDLAVVAQLHDRESE